MNVGFEQGILHFTSSMIGNVKDFMTRFILDPVYQCKSRYWRGSDDHSSESLFNFEDEDLMDSYINHKWDLVLILDKLTNLKTSIGKTYFYTSRTLNQYNS